MNNSDMPAAPVITSTTMDTEQSTLTSVGTTGLTKREHFAGLAMQGLLAHYGDSDAYSIVSAVRYADALLKELEISHE
jgi:hypothetical protein